MSGRRSPAAPLGERPEITAPGARPAADASAGCARPGCGHPRALHSNGKSPCRAFACSAGPCGSCRGSAMETNGEDCAACHGRGTTGPCPEFVDRADDGPERRLLAS
jgi:hypothetical protein